jgi:predicted transcriptional regulator
MKYGERAETAYQLYLSGKTTEQIAKLMGIKKMSVCGYISTAEAHHRPIRCEQCGLTDE